MIKKNKLEKFDENMSKVYDGKLSTVESFDSFYRTPTKKEMEEFSEYMYKKEKRELNVLGIFDFSLIIIAIALLLALFLLQCSLGERIVRLVLGIGSLLLSFLFRKEKREIIGNIRKVYDGKFYVLDCKCFESEILLDYIGDAAFRIYKDDIYCNKWFSANNESLKIWKNNKDYPFKLVYIPGDKGKNTYELFTESKLDEAR